MWTAENTYHRKRYSRFCITVLESRRSSRGWGCTTPAASPRSVSDPGLLDQSLLPKQLSQPVVAGYTWISPERGLSLIVWFTCLLCIRWWLSVATVIIICSTTQRSHPVKSLVLCWLVVYNPPLQLLPVATKWNPSRIFMTLFKDLKTAGCPKKTVLVWRFHVFLAEAWRMVMTMPSAWLSEKHFHIQIWLGL